MRREPRDAQAAKGFRSAVTVWHKAQAQQGRDVTLVGGINQKIDLFSEALSELGIAEYTGQAAQQGTNFQAKETEVDEVQFGEVAATDTAADLKEARAALAVARHHLHATRVLVASTYAGMVAARGRLDAAGEQVAWSLTGVQFALDWATIAGQAPAQPLKTLVSMEGSLAFPAAQAASRQRDRHAARGVSLSGQSGAAHTQASELPASSTHTMAATTVPPTTTTVPPTTTTTVPTTTTTVPTTTGTLSGATPGPAAPAGATPATTVTTSGAGVGPGRSTPAVLATLGPSILGPSVLSRSQILGGLLRPAPPPTSRSPSAGSSTITSQQGS